MPLRLEPAEAAFAIALHRYVTLRGRQGERVTQLAAEKILALLVLSGCHLTGNLRELGFRICEGNIRPLGAGRLAFTLRQLDEVAGAAWVDPIVQAVRSLRVRDLERLNPAHLLVANGQLAALRSTTQEER